MNNIEQLAALGDYLLRARQTGNTTCQLVGATAAPRPMMLFENHDNARSILLTSPSPVKTTHSLEHVIDPKHVEVISLGRPLSEQLAGQSRRPLMFDNHALGNLVQRTMNEITELRVELQRRRDQLAEIRSILRA